MEGKKDILDSPEIVAHTESILTLKLRLAKPRGEEVAISIDIGRHLLDVFKLVPCGDRGRYLKTGVDVHLRELRSNSRTAITHRR